MVIYKVDSNIQPLNNCGLGHSMWRASTVPENIPRAVNLLQSIQGNYIAQKVMEESWYWFKAFRDIYSYCVDNIILLGTRWLFMNLGEATRTEAGGIKFKDLLKFEEFVQSLDSHGTD